MIMAVKMVNEWLHHCDGTTFASSSFDINKNDTLIDSIITVIEDRKFHDELIDKVCNELFGYCRCKTEERKRFPLTFIPSLIGLHLTTKPAEKKRYQCVDVLLLGMYNLFVVDDDGHTLCRTFRMPSLAKPSIYHEPSPLSSQQQQSALTEHALSKLENGTVIDTIIPLFGPYCECERIISSNRMEILTVLLKIYNENISSLPKQSMDSLCRMCLKILKCGANSGKVNSGKGNFSPILYSEIIARNPSPIQLSSSFLVEIVNSIYYCMYNDLADVALQALEEVHKRAVNQLYTNVLLMTNAIRNSLRVIPSGQPSDGPMGLSIALSPTSNNPIEGIPTKTAITNASFKTRKLPDDIPIVTGNVSNPQLGSIEETEEGEKSSKSAIKVVTAGIGKMAVMQRLKERKERKKDEQKDKKKKMRNENGDICINKAILNDENGFGSDTSGVSDEKLSFSEEMIPLSEVMPDEEFDGNDYNDENDDNGSNGSDSSLDAAKVPLVMAESVQNSVIKHNIESSINV